MNERLQTPPAPAGLLHCIGAAWTRHPLESLCDLAFAAFALWTLVWYPIYFLGGSFQTAVGAGVVILLVSPLLPAAIRPLQGAADAPPAMTGREAWALLGLVLIAVLLTLIVHRPDADDEHYVAIAVGLLADPAAAMMHLPIMEIGTSNGRYAISVFSQLSGALTAITGLPLLFWYYLGLPVILATLMMLVLWRLLRLLVGREWIIGAFVVLLVMAAWGDVHRTQANFGLVRLFQGKAVLVAVVVPAILFYFLRYVRGGGRRGDLAMLVCAAVAGIGATPTGLALAPLMIAVLAAAALPMVGWGRFLPGVVAFAALVVPLGLLTWLLYGHLGTAIHVGGGRFVEQTTNADMLQLTMGPDLRGMFMFAAAGVSFLAVRDPVLRQLLRNYILIFLIMIAFPWTSMLLAEVTYGTFSWRWLWMLPFPALAAVAVAGAFGVIRARLGMVVALLLLAGFTAWFLSVSPRRVISHENNAEVRMPGYKIDRGRLQLRPFETTAEVRDGRLYAEGFERGF